MSLDTKTNLYNKVAVVTGGGGVLGGKMAEALAEVGVQVAILDLKQEAADKKAKEIIAKGGKAIGIEANVLDRASLEAAKVIVNNQFGKVDILINGAGGNHPKGTTSKEYMTVEDIEGIEGVTSFFDLDAKGIEFVFNLNFLGTLMPSQVFAKDMINNHAVIINISSMNAFTPLTKIPAYSGAKAAVSNFTQWLAVHLSKVGIRVNAIAPGFFITAQNKTLLTNEDGSFTERANKILGQTPMERFGQPEELIGTLLWLVNHETSSFVNGVVIPVDGGFSAYSGV